MRSRFLVSGVVLALALALSQTVALAVPATQYLHIQLWPETATQIMFLESAEYSPATKLPATVKLAIPKGAQIQWAGEVLGGDASKDIQAAYKLNRKKDYDEVVFSLTKGKAAQVEALWNGVTRKGNTSVITLDWVQRYPAAKVDFGFKAPAQNSSVKTNPDWAVTNAGLDKLRFYVTAPMTLGVGDKKTFSVTYTGTPTSGGQSQTKGNQPLGDGTTSSSSNASLVILLVLVVGGAVAATIYVKTHGAD